MIPVLSPNDPYFNNVSLLLSARDGLIKDYSKNNLSITNNGVTVSSTQAKWGNKSFYFAPSQYNYLYIPDNNVLNFGTSSFTIEIILYITSITSYNGLFDMRYNSQTPIPFLIDYRLNSKLHLYVNNASVDLLSVNQLSANQWISLSIVRDVNNFKCYVNGISVIETNYSGSINSNLGVTIGSFFARTVNDKFNGYIQEIRVTKGIARPIQVPSQPFPNW